MQPQLKNIRHLSDFEFELEYHDGTKGTINFKDVLKFEGVFKDLQKVENIKKAYIDPETKVLTWPNGADFDPYVLYSLVTKKEVPFAQ